MQSPKTYFTRAMTVGLISLAATSVSQAKTLTGDEIVKKMEQLYYRISLKEATINRTEPFTLTSVSISRDCTAEVTCPSGVKLTCSVQGINTSCGASNNSVGCFTYDDDEEGVGGTTTCSE
ncbi:MAG: hypothetical protein P8163_06080 [Candidatus Thiodiazotropha sp.]